MLLLLLKGAIHLVKINYSTAQKSSRDSCSADFVPSWCYHVVLHTNDSQRWSMFLPF